MPSPTTADIRAWAQQTGHPVGDRGRLPAELVEAYNKANRTGKSPAQPATKASLATAPVTKSAKKPASKPASKPTGRPVTKPAVLATADPAPVQAATSPPVTPKPTDPDVLTARISAAEVRLVELSRRLETLENAPRGLFGRRRA